MSIYASNLPGLVYTSIQGFHILDTYSEKSLAFHLTGSTALLETCLEIHVDRRIYLQQLHLVF